METVGVDNSILYVVSCPNSGLGLQFGGFYNVSHKRVVHFYDNVGRCKTDLSNSFTFASKIICGTI